MSKSAQRRRSAYHQGKLDARDEVTSQALMDGPYATAYSAGRDRPWEPSGGEKKRARLHQRQLAHIAHAKAMGQYR